MVAEPEGFVFDIRRFSTHDGPGIRTTVFFKGCPLKCLWCHNPESQDLLPELMLFDTRCISCGACVSACTRQAITFSVNGTSRYHTDRDACASCGDCLSTCFADARTIVGRSMAVSDVMLEIEKDLPFFDESGGGVTVSGGEPLYQSEFLLALLRACRVKEIHTALDTSGFASWQTLDEISAYVDLFLYDLKIMDDGKHREFTGVSNQIILENLAALSDAGHDIVLRIPLIPGVNDDDENIHATALFASGLKSLKHIDILPYHNMGFGKYNGLGKNISIEQTALSQERSLPDERLATIVKTLQNHRLQAYIG